METSKPDNIVFDEDSKRYDASIKPYGTNVGAPAIQLTNTAFWKNSQVQKVNHQFKARFEELQTTYAKMMQEFEYNKLIYNASFNFEPVVGNVYHLYKDKSEQPFLSIIPPEECRFNFINSFRLNAEMIWDKIEDKN